MRSMYEGNLDLSDTFADEMYFCLDCQACQTACPAGVQYGTLVEDVRRIIAEKKRDPLSIRILKALFLKGVLSSKTRTRLAGKLLGLYHRSGLWEAVQLSNVLRLLSDRLHEKHSMLPSVNGRFFDETVSEVVSPKEKPRGRVAFLSGCIMNIALPEVHKDAVDVLVHNGFEVVIPRRNMAIGHQRPVHDVRRHQVAAVEGAAAIVVGQHVARDATDRGLV